MIEEFHHEDATYAEGVDARLIPHNANYWGPSYFMHDNKKNYFVSEVEKVSRYAVPFIKNIKYLMTPKKT